MPKNPAAAAAAATMSCGFPVATGMPNALEGEVGCDPALVAVAVAASGDPLILIPGVTLGMFFFFSRSRLTRDS